MTLVRVVWRDSGLRHESGWYTPAQIENITHVVEEVGYVIHEDNEHITLVMGRVVDSDPPIIYGAHSIWKQAIIEIDHSLTRKEDQTSA